MRTKNKKQLDKINKRFEIEKVIKCKDCKFLFNGICFHNGYERHKNMTACYAFLKLENEK